MLGMFLAGVTQTDMSKMAQPILDICNAIVPVLLAIVGAVGAIFVIFLGVKYAKSDDPQEHEKAKAALRNAIIGFILIFVLLIMLNIGLSVFTKYYADAITA